MAGHFTRKGSGRMKIIKHRLPGAKIARKCHEGMLTLRNGCGLAGRLALERKLGLNNKSFESVRDCKR